MNMFRQIIQHRPRFKILLTGSHSLEEFGRWASYLINVQIVQISYLSEAETQQLIERPVQDFALRYEPEASRRIFALTRGHPFLVQLLCAEVVALKNEQDPAVRRLANLADVETAAPAALSHGSFFFADIQRNQLDSLAPEILRWLALQGEGATVDLAGLSRHFPTGLEEGLATLTRRQLIEPANGGYRFQVELIRRWFAQL
jgi:predicted ATPase